MSVPVSEVLAFSHRTAVAPAAAVVPIAPSPSGAAPASGSLLTAPTASHGGGSC